MKFRYLNLNNQILNFLFPKQNNNNSKNILIKKIIKNLMLNLRIYLTIYHKLFFNFKNFYCNIIYKNFNYINKKYYMKIIIIWINN